MFSLFYLSKYLICCQTFIKNDKQENQTITQQIKWNNL